MFIRHITMTNHAHTWYSIQDQLKNNWLFYGYNPAAHMKLSCNIIYLKKREDINC